MCTCHSQLFPITSDHVELLQMVGAQLMILGAQLLILGAQLLILGAQLLILELSS